MADHRFCTRRRSTNLYAYVGNGPTSRRDALGLWFGIDDLIFGLGGAIIGVGGKALGDIITGQTSGLEDYVGAFVGGAAGGETLLYTANPFLAGAVGGAASNALTQGLKMISGKQKCFDAKSFAFDTAFGAATGFIPGRPRIPGINSGRNSSLKFFREMTTKARNGTIGNIAPMTGLKMANGAFLEYAMPQGAAAGTLGSVLYGEYGPEGGCQ